jgi:hypothetical protein
MQHVITSVPRADCVKCNELIFYFRAYFLLKNWNWTLTTVVLASGTEKTMASFQHFARKRVGVWQCLNKALWTTLWNNKFFSNTFYKCIIGIELSIEMIRDFLSFANMNVPRVWYQREWFMTIWEKACKKHNYYLPTSFWHYLSILKY